MALIEDTLTGMISNQGSIGRQELDAALLADFRNKQATVDTSAPFAGANRVNEGARLRGSNTQATIDSSGRTVITGSGSAEGATLQGSSSSSTPQTTEFNLGLAIQSIDSETDLDKKISLAEKLSGDLSAFTAKRLADYTSVADEQSGVKRLEAQLLKEIEMDKAHPAYTGVPSIQRLEVERQLDQAKQDSRFLTEKLLKSDPELARVTTEGDLKVKNVLNDVIGARNRDERLNEKDYEKGLMLPAEVKEFVKTTRPVETAGLSDGRLFDFSKLALSKEEQKAAMASGSPEALLDLYSTEDNLAAKNFLVKSKAKGDPMKEQELSSQIDEFKLLSSDPQAAFKAAKGNLATKLEKEELSANLLKLNSGSKEERAQALNWTKRQALEAMTMTKIKEFSTISNWNPGDLEFIKVNPATADVYRRASDKKGGDVKNLSYQDLLAELAILPADKFEVAKEVLVGVATKEAEKINSSSIWQVPNKYELITQANRSRVMKELGLGGAMPGFMESLIASTTFGQVSLPQLEAAAGSASPTNLSTGVITR